jgi:hypothetical protein
MKNELRRWKSGPFLGLLVAAVGLASGCNVSVTVPEGFADQSLEVHLVGVKAVDFDRWNEKSMTEYWQPGDLLREEAVWGTGKVKKPLVDGWTGDGHAVVMTFGKGKPRTWVLAPNHPCWENWRAMGAKYLFILASLGPGEDKPGHKDLRRQIVRMDFLPPWGPMEISVRKTGIYLESVKDRKLPEDTK